MQTDKKCRLDRTTISGIILLAIATTAIAQADDLTSAAVSDTLSKFSDSTHELIGYCAPYHGKVCKSFITSSQVWYSNVSAIDTSHLH